MSLLLLFGTLWTIFTLASTSTCTTSPSGPTWSFTCTTSLPGTASTSICAEMMSLNMPHGSKMGQQIPTWDGSPQRWRKYVKEVEWYARSVKASERQHIVGRLIPNLSGNARLLAMSWHIRQFDGERGLVSYLQTLAASPLVRRAMPNAAATLDRYFVFARAHQESISNFLVREALGFEEFTEALKRLKEESEGITAQEMAFDLPETTHRDADSWWHEPDSWSTWWEAPDDDLLDDGGPHVVPEDAETESSSHDRPTILNFTKDSSTQTDTPAFGEADSFILSTLRGYRLLKAACLSSEERRDVLATTGHKLDFKHVSEALSSLWDELGSLRRGNHHQAMTVDMSGWTWSDDSGWYDESWAQDGETWNDDSGWYEGFAMDQWTSDSWTDDSGWYDEGGWQDSSWYDGSWSGDSWTHEAQKVEAENDPEVKKALEDVKAAEALAMEGQRTLAAARSVVANARKDRGFGGVSSGSGSGCFICGGPHMAAQCPDRLAPKGNLKGKGKIFAFGKGKGKVKGKMRKGMGKSAHYVDEAALQELMLAGKKGRSKGKSLPAGKSGLGANLYYTYGLEIETQTAAVADAAAELPNEVQSTASSADQKGLGMIDCGASASAGSEQAIQRLVSAVISKDPAAKIEVTNSNASRPYFRFGNGVWDRALYALCITSSLMRTFHCYCLPTVTAKPGEAPVPLLVGMTFLKPAGTIIDFANGSIVHAHVDNSEPRQMQCNPKGHYLIDIAEFLTDSCSSAATQFDDQCCVSMSIDIHPDSAGEAEFTGSLNMLQQMTSADDEDTCVDDSLARSTCATCSDDQLACSSSSTCLDDKLARSTCSTCMADSMACSLCSTCMADSMACSLCTTCVADSMACSLCSTCLDDVMARIRRYSSGLLMIGLRILFPVYYVKLAADG